MVTGFWLPSVSVSISELAAWDMLTQKLFIVYLAFKLN